MDWTELINKRHDFELGKPIGSLPSYKCHACGILSIVAGTARVKKINTSTMVHGGIIEYDPIYCPYCGGKYGIRNDKEGQ